MKLLTTTLAVLFFLSVSAQNNDRFKTAMRIGISMTDSARSSESFTNAANYFERIANAELTQWLPHYYTAYSLLMSANMGRQDNDTKDVIFDKALMFLEKADKIQAGNSEILALQGYIVFMKVSLSPQARAMTLIPKSNVLIEKAISIDPANPRASLIKGQNLFYTPEAFGGGKAKAAGVLKEALVKFDEAKPVDLMPSWGKARCEQLIAQAAK